MSNHFHVLVEVPKRPEKPEEVVTDEELVARVTSAKVTMGPEKLEELLADLKERGAEGEHELNRLREQFYVRMWDVSWFMRFVKQRFTQWYNKRKGRQGTLWQDRFRSTLVEGNGQALMANAAYIDLNPVRAGIVENPSEYRWSGYGEAMGGVKEAEEGIRRVVELWMGNGEVTQEVTLKRGMEEYRKKVWERGEERGVGEDGVTPLRKGLNREAVKEMVKSGGVVPWQEALMCRVRYFTDGQVMGGRAFVNRFFERNRERFGPNRKDGARKLRGIAMGDVFSLRDLQVAVLG
jgi:REP element-mobilizing transposase RayT